MSAVENEVIEILRPLLQEVANARQGFIPFYQAVELIHRTPKVRELVFWNRYESINRFFEHISDECKDWMRVDSECQGLRIPNHSLNISHWGNITDDFRNSVIHTLVEIDDPIPFFGPDVYNLVFGTIGRGLILNDQTIDIAHEVFHECHAHFPQLPETEKMTLEIAIHLVTTIRDHLSSIRRNLRNPAIAAKNCARIWRMQIFRLARMPEFMSSEAGCKHLCTWFAVDGEPLEDGIAALEKRMRELRRSGGRRIRMS